MRCATHTTHTYNFTHQVALCITDAPFLKAVAMIHMHMYAVCNAYHTHFTHHMVVWITDAPFLKAVTTIHMHMYAVCNVYHTHLQRYPPGGAAGD